VQSKSEFVHIQVEQHYYLHYRDIDEANQEPLNYEVYHAYCLLRAESDRSHWDNGLLESRVHEAGDEAMVQESDRVRQVVMIQWR
jgi:hypothetical protein